MSDPRRSPPRPARSTGRATAVSRPRASAVRAWLAAALALVATACLERREAPGGEQAQGECATCHGDPTRPGDALRRAAPPRDLLGASTPEYPGVGAHDLHLSASATHGPVACAECHVVPERTDSPGHADAPRPARITFGELARQGDHDPAYDAESRICGNTYCHGRAGAVWSNPRTSEAACGTCHGLPPAAPHPQSGRCSSCHGAVVDAERHIIAPELHVNGKVEQGPAPCTACHGSGDQPAPPRDSHGNTEVSAIGVGAHRAHLDGGLASRPLACTECHVVPTPTDRTTHVGGGPATVVLGGIAATKDRTPAWDHAAVTCGDTWCHGPDPGSPGTSPPWTTSGPLACTGCHGAPPPAPHPQSTECGSCHGTVAGPGATIAHRELHVDGVVQTTTGKCTDCHGSGSDPAPPRDTKGNVATSAAGVGAHQAHLTGGKDGRPLACTECHAVPSGAELPKHVDGTPAEVRIEGVGASFDRAPAWNGPAATCGNTWCHSPDPGTAAASPVWTAQAGIACDGCHGAPPPAPHPQSAECGSCHGTVAGQGATIAHRELHVDGVVQTTTGTCTDCHGSGSDPAPPRDTKGNTDRSAVGVGAHQAHLTGGRGGRPLACVECHALPLATELPKHVDGAPAAVRIQGVGASFDRKPAWDHTATTCGETWCHGPDQGAAGASPPWTSTASLSCTSCHGAPPPLPHPQTTACSVCHGAVVGADGVTILDASRHVNGVVDLSLPTACTGCHGGPKDPAPLPGTPAAGAHRTHLDGTASAAAVPCDTCHRVPAAVLDPGHLDSAAPGEVVFSGRALANGATPTYSNGTCAGTPCHGGAMTNGHASGGTNTTPEFDKVDGSQTTCGSCHGLPPPAPHPYGNLNPVCSKCHENIAPDNVTFTRPDLHVDGTVTFQVP